MRETGVLCVKHGGEYDGPDAFWYCDQCARSGINKCECGEHARYFGEALMCSISCEKCDSFIAYVGDDFNVRDAWNNGQRGNIGTQWD